MPGHDATVVSKLKDAGAVILGKTHMHEWAKSSHTNNVFYGPSRNPVGREPGPPAVPVAAPRRRWRRASCLASIGTDSAGSVRNPAALCGIAGLKPTHGRVSHERRGARAPGPGSINHFGVLAKTAEDCAVVLNCIAGADPRRIRISADVPVPDYTQRASRAGHRRAEGRSCPGLLRRR